MTRYLNLVLVLVWISIGSCFGDTFKHLQSGEIFQGYATQKSIGQRTRVYNADKGKFSPLVLSEYVITANSHGRRNSIVFVPIQAEEIMLSQAVSERVAATIVEASNKGPLAIVVEIDNPGGRGEYMRNISSAISETDNCPVVAFVNSGQYGGAYSAAVVLALACDKIYITSDSSLGTISPIVGRSISDTDITEFSAMYSSPSLAAYSGYVASLAEKHGRPGAIAQAMVNQNVEVLEVSDREGNRSFITGNDKTASMTIVKTWSSSVRQYGNQTNPASSGKSGRTTLTLSAKDAIYCGIADKIVGSRMELVKEIGGTEAKIITSNTSVKIIKKFNATRRNLDKLLVSIDYLQGRADQLYSQLTNIESTVPQTTVTRRSKELYREDREVGGVSGTTRFHQSLRNRNYIDSEVEVQTTPGVNTGIVADDLAFVLANLVRDYRKAVVLSRRYPGALPRNVTLRELERRQGMALAMQNDIDARYVPRGRPRKRNTPRSSIRRSRGR